MDYNLIPDGSTLVPVLKCHHGDSATAALHPWSPILFLVHFHSNQYKNLILLARSRIQLRMMLESCKVVGC